MANVRTLDFRLIDELFEMQSGYVLDFSDRTIQNFFFEELNVDFSDPLYAQEGTSKAKRLRCYLRTVDTASAVTALKTLWNYRKALYAERNKAEPVHNAEGRLLELLNRIQGTTPPAQGPGQTPVRATNIVRLNELKAELHALASLAPQARGYAFERFLVALFNFFQLKAAEPFRLRGEQIDGSFDLNHEIYLLEAKWQNDRTSAADLRIFHGKIEEKAAWTRGLFVSHSGFEDDGLHAFGRGKRLICMDGLDIYDALDRNIPLNEVLHRKVRRASETGFPFHRVRDLF
jgi:hypothetical protein